MVHEIKINVMGIKFASQQKWKYFTCLLFSYKISSNLLETFSFIRDINYKDSHTRSNSLYYTLFLEALYWTRTLRNGAQIFRPHGGHLLDHYLCPHGPLKAVRTAVSWHIWSLESFLKMDPWVPMTQPPVEPPHSHSHVRSCHLSRSLLAAITLLFQPQKTVSTTCLCSGCSSDPLQILPFI